MTYAPGIEETGAALDPKSRADLDKPQGLKSAPTIPHPNYPHLGFNPVPGSTQTVRDLHLKLAACAKVLEDTHDLVTKLLDGSYWKGDAAVAFREQLDGGPLPRNLRNAARSLCKAVTQLSRWETELDDFQRRAKRLESDAQDARDAVKRAEGKAEAVVDDAQSELDKVLGRARRLAEEHEARAKHRAGKIRAATQKLAPHEPGWFDDALDWLGENLPDVLSFLAGTIAVAALLLSGPLGWGLATVGVLMLGSSAISLTALFLRLGDPAVRASLWDGIRHGELDADFWSNSVSVGADLAGALPGVGAVGKGAFAGIREAARSTTAVSLGEKLSVVGTRTMDEAKGVASLDNALVVRAVRGLSDPEKAARAVQGSSGLVGVGTGGFGLHNKVVDAEDDGIKDGTVAGIDGSRLALDTGAIYALARHVL
ncbi:hypothetical protein STRCI_005210 [Streptomyces cinnabarinus]|uniref:Integral membrane protein n=1 Tax=Streptomyces cinnabarinus TaxID=67287 RepID=A0ABY7KJS1_9ACTN|nr:hypothetical protein [Streptomyces cinnabarinus]WAZ23840.1 hypothetical protein STRCI_005210 [Streptomyces cinnabarinus]